MSAEITTLEASMLALLALMIGFTFSMMLTLFETRKQAVLNEANAIRRIARGGRSARAWAMVRRSANAVRGCSR
jgi:hypothetical protein